VSTEAAIDELVSEDFDAAEEEVERSLLRSSQGCRPSTAAAAAAIVPLLNIAPAAMVFDNANVDPEQDEREFYQIILTARGTKQAGTNASQQTRKNSGSGSVNSGAQVAQSPSGDSAPRVTRVSSGRRAHSGIPRSSPSSSPTPDQSFASPAPRSSPDHTVRRSPSYRSEASSASNQPRPASRTHSTTSSGVTSMMRQMQLGGGGMNGSAASGDEWSDRLAREQDIERRRYVEQHHAQQATAPSLHRPLSSTGGSTAAATGGVKFPKLK
jgi:hypothetical protein